MCACVYCSVNTGRKKKEGMSCRFLTGEHNPEMLPCGYKIPDPEMPPSITSPCPWLFSVSSRLGQRQDKTVTLCETSSDGLGVGSFVLVLHVATSLVLLLPARAHTQEKMEGEAGKRMRGFLF